jgi:hypothetical protein
VGPARFTRTVWASFRASTFAGLDQHGIWDNTDNRRRDDLPRRPSRQSQVALLRRLQSSWAALRNVHDRVRSRPCRIRHTGRKLARSQPPACLWRCLFPGGSKICPYGRDGRRKAATMTPPLRLCIGSFFTSPVHGLLRGCSRSGPKRSHNVSNGTPIYRIADTLIRYGVDLHGRNGITRDCQELCAWP